MQPYTKYQDLFNNPTDELKDEFFKEVGELTRYQSDILCLYKQFLEYNILVDISTVVNFWYEASESYCAVFLDVHEGSLNNHLFNFEFSLKLSDSPDFMNVLRYISKHIDDINFGVEEVNKINEFVSTHLKYAHDKNISEELNKLYPVKKDLSMIVSK